MSNFFQMAQIQSVLFLYMLVGFICRKAGIVKGSARQSFTDFVIYVSLPCMVFQSFNMEFTAETIRQGAEVLMIASVLALVAWLIGHFAYNWCNPREKCIMQYGTLVSNSGFAGLPVVEGAYGAEGLFLGSLFIIPTRILMWSAGISLFTDAPLKQRVKSVMLNPGIISVELGILRMVTGVHIPEAINRAMNAFSGTATPLGMVIIGMILAEIDPRAVLEPKAFILVAVRQLLFPLGTLAVLSLLPVAPMSATVSVVLTGMPIGCTTAILADKYGADSTFASKCVFISTLTSLITIPILTLFL